jgi:two-component system, LytTR family, sensor kinase
MKNFLDKHINFNRVEFWAVTTLYVFFVFFHISYALQLSNAPQTTALGIVRRPFDYYFVAPLIQNTVLYLVFLFLNFMVVPKLVKKENILLNILFIVLAFLVTSIVFGLTNTSLKYEMISGYRTDAYTHNSLIQNAFLYSLWLLCMFGFYSVLKYASLYLLSKSEAIQARYKFVTQGGLIALVAWMIGLFAISVSDAERGFVAITAILPPSTLFLYWYTFYSLIPLSLQKKKPVRAYAIRILLVISISSFFLGLLAMLLAQNEDIGAAFGLFNFFFQLFIIAPLCWILFKRQMKGNEELYVLRRELGQTHASFDFLRSQINPHFLFNALNTIYGTALQEKAERTSEGIEKLGDMMRFMLQENLQDKISLAREIDYLNNYISLQKLRTDPNPTIQIDTFIEPQVSTTQIAPMLLIPFVENAFKHGISFREPSQIKVTLEFRSNTLYFDVYNTKHTKPDNDPEKNKSGIGLNNVRQRLLMTYPGKHELVIRETVKDFFVHLTIQLT